MKDIFDAKILCKKCNVEMNPATIEKFGFKMRAIECPECSERIIHPGDLSELKNYQDLKRKTYNVKLRVVGNSHAISIPKEIVDFINEANHRMSRQMNDVVRLCFEDFGKLSLNFLDEDARRIKRKWQQYQHQQVVHIHQQIKEEIWVE